MIPIQTKAQYMQLSELSYRMSSGEPMQAIGL